MSLFLNVFHMRLNANGSGAVLTIKALLKNVRCNQNYNDANVSQRLWNVNFAQTIIQLVYYTHMW